METNAKISRDVLEEIIKEAIEGSKASIASKIRLNVDENSFYHPIANNFEKVLEKRKLSMYTVDTNYNRAAESDGGKGVGIYDEKNKIVTMSKNNQFDIIVHMNGAGDIIYPENLIHLEVKKYNNNQDRKKDKERLLSTTKHPEAFSTRCLGVIINTDIFESFYNSYKENHIFRERAEQIEKCLEDVKKSNQEIFTQYCIDYSKTNLWFSNIIAGYQLGAFVDIFPDKIEITYYYSGEEGEMESIEL